jgi:hypothetical protein
MFSALLCFAFRSLLHAAPLVAEIQMNALVMSLAVFGFVIFRLRVDSRSRTVLSSTVGSTSKDGDDVGFVAG